MPRLSMRLDFELSEDEQAAIAAHMRSAGPHPTRAEVSAFLYTATANALDEACAARETQARQTEVAHTT
jgi:hypothetical protein